MLDASRHYFHDNIRELERIDEFERLYISEGTIQWYTRNSFVYRFIIIALRTKDVEQLNIFRYFIQDLCLVLTMEHIQLSDVIRLHIMATSRSL